jgi:hypothetical protein
MAQSTWQKLKNQWAAETRDEEKLAAHLVMLFADVFTRFDEYYFFPPMIRD